MDRSSDGAGDETPLTEGKGSPPRIWGGVAALAAHQHGIVSGAQLRALGVTPKAVEARARAGHLHRLHRGVFAVGHTALTKQGRYMAAVLAGGPGAALSHRAAADLWAVRPGSGLIEVTIPRCRKGPAGLTVHRSHMLDPVDFAAV